MSFNEPCDPTPLKSYHNYNRDFEFKLQIYYRRSSAKMIALVTSCILTADNLVILSSNMALGIVIILSRFTAHRTGMPSCSVICTSEGILRIVRVTTATVTEVLIVYAESLDNKRSGRRPTGGGSSPHHTSPRCTYQDSFDNTWPNKATCISPQPASSGIRS